MILFLSTAYTVVAQESVSPEVTSAKSSFAQCVGGDITQLKSTGVMKCLQHKDTFVKYASEYGLTDMGVDLLSIMTIAQVESGCRSREELPKDSENRYLAGIMQAVYDCRRIPETCPDIDSEIKSGIKILADTMKRAKNAGITGRQGLWLGWFGYSRGGGTEGVLVKKMKEGKTIQQAGDEACTEYTNKKSYCPDSIRKKYNCAAEGKAGVMCENGKTCAYNAECFIEDKEVGIHYSDRAWKFYKQNCADIGGRIVDEGGPIEASKPSTTTPGATPAPTTGGAYKPTHPYFTVPYSVNPSFSVSISYDFSLYDSIPKQLKKIELCKSDMDCVLGNVSLVETENPSRDWIVSYGGNVLTQDAEGGWEDYKWEAYCEKPDEWALNSLAESMYNCANSKDKDCFCTYSLPIISQEEVNKWYGRALSFGLGKIPIIGPLLGLASFAATEMSSSKSWEQRVFSFSKSGGVRISYKGKSATQLVPGSDFKEVGSDWKGDSSKEFLYKITDIGKNVSIYKDKSGNLSILKEGAGSSKECVVNDKVVKFCVVQNATFMAYNQAQNVLGLQQLVLKFAYVFRSSVSDISNFEVYDAKFAQNSSLLVWDPAQTGDVDYYTIYYSADPATEGNLKGKSPADAAEFLGNVQTAILPDASKQDADVSMSSLMNPYCIVDSYACKPSYALETRIVNEPFTADLNQEQLYLSRVANKLFYILPGVNDGQKYYYYITATGSGGDESPSFTTPVKQENSLDDIPPGLAKIQGAKVDGSNVVFSIEQVTQNIEGTPLDPASVDFYRFYCFDIGVTGDLNLSTKEPGSIRLTAADPYPQLIMPWSDFNAYCGGAMTARMIVAAVKKGGVEFKDTISQNSPAVMPIIVS